MLVAFPALLFVARPAIPLRLLLGYGLTISFGQFAFCSALSAWHAGGAGVAGAAGASLFTIILGAFVFGERLQGKQLAGIALAIFGVLVLVEGARRGACPTGGLYADPGGAQLACGNIFNKIMSQATPPANHIAGGVERIDPGAGRLCLPVADRWPAAHAGESTPDRYADGSSLLLAWRLSPPSSAMVSGARCWGAMKPAGWRRCRRWCR